MRIGCAVGFHVDTAVERLGSDVVDSAVGSRMIICGAPLSVGASVGYLVGDAKVGEMVGTPSKNKYKEE